MHSLAPALILTLTLTQILSLKHLANTQLRSSHSLYSLINDSATDLPTGLITFTSFHVPCYMTHRGGGVRAQAHLC